MRRSQRTDACVNGPGQQKQPAAPDNSKELHAAWTSLSQTKAALRHIENRLEATPGSGGVLLHSVLDTKKTSSGSTKKPGHREGRRTDDSSQTGGASKPGGRGRGSSRSPLRNTTQESNVRKTSMVEFREPLASYREATPPPMSSSQIEAYTLQSLPDSSHPSYSSSSLPPPPPRSASDPLLSLLIYQRDTRDRQTEPDQNSLPSTAPDGTEVRYLNDRPAVEALRASSRPADGRPNAPTPGPASPTASPATATSTLASSNTPAPGCAALSGDTSASSSPGSASQKLEKLRRRQPDDKLEKLKERIRKQRENLEGAAERDKLQGRLEQPILPQPHHVPAKIQRKVAPAPPAPIYRGFNPSETKIRTPDGKVWREEDFHNLSRDVYRDLSRQLAESTRTSRQQQQPRERRPAKPIRKVCKASTTIGTDPLHKPVISTSSWRDGQKLVKMLLGPSPRMHQEERAQSAEGADRTGASPQRPSSSSSPSRPHLPPRPHSRGRSPAAPSSQPPPPATSSTDLLSADLRCILDDLQLERGGPERGRGGRRGGSAGSRAPLSAWGPVPRPSRSASPGKRPPPPQRERHYNADTVRLYIAKQQEERKRRQAQERTAQREEAERRSQRLQELYRKQRGGGGGGGAVRGGGGGGADPEGFVVSVQSRLQETYTKLTEPNSTIVLQQQQQQLRPVYQPSGESDKENKRQAPQSPSSSSDMSLSAAPLSRTELGGVEGASSQLHPAGCPVPTSSMMPPAEQLLSQLLGLQAGAPRAHRDPPPPASSRSSHQAASPTHRSRLSRIEALKATAASLSTRIESEARKLLDPPQAPGPPATPRGEEALWAPGPPATPRGEEALWAPGPPATPRGEEALWAPGPPATPRGEEALWAPGPPATPRGEEALWAPSLSPPVRETSACSDHLARRIQKILNSAGGQSSYDAAALPGVGDLHGFIGHREKTTASRPRPDEEGGRLTNGGGRMEGWRRRYGEEEEEGGRRAGGHDSSGGSISEGPLLSDDSLSGGERTPPPLHPPLPHRTTRTARTRPSVRLGAVDYCEAQRGAHSLGELSLFQREAERYPPLSPTDLHTHWDRSSSSTKAPWEELAKGSPLSVINIFTRNLRAADDRPERSSPPVRSVQSAVSPGDDAAAAAAYEDDFVSLRSSGGSGQSKKGSSGRSVNNHYEELMRRSPYESRATTRPSSTGSTPLPSHPSSLRSPGSSPDSAPLSRTSNGRRGLVESERSDSTVVEEHHSPCTPPSETPSAVSRQSPSPGPVKSACSASPPGGSPGHSPRSLTSDSKKSPVCSPSQHSGSLPGPASPSKAQDSDSSLGLDGRPQGLGPGGSPAKTRGRPTAGHSAFSTAPSYRVEAMTTAELQFAPAVLHQRLHAELSYLDSIEESVRQLGDVERIRGVSLAQQETVSLAQILKAQKQRHERDLTELKIKAEREALEAQLEMEESRQRAARAHLEAQQSMVQAQQKSLGELHEATSHLINQQTIREMKELGGPAPPYHQHHGLSARQPHSRTHTHSSRTEASDSRSRPEDDLSSLGSASLSHSRRLDIGGGDSISHHSLPGQRERKRRRKEERNGRHTRAEERGGSSSVEEEVQSAIDDSLPSDHVSSVREDLDTEYSMKFDESLTEDEMEERSFRSLLPSEAHRRGTLENRPRPHQGSDHETTIHDKSSPSRTLDSSKLQDSSLVFSSGQDSFSRFTMDMVRQYMQDEEVRAHHQNSLLLLRQKALKEKTRAQLAWLEHQKRRLRDKGEDDKMPPIRKKQRGLLMKLQQEQAEIKRLQEASRAARKERQMLLKQQEEIQRMRHSTLRLKERLKSAAAAEDMPLDSPVSEPPEVSEVVSPATGPPGSPSPPCSPPLSVSGSETSSIMEKLKKMRSHTDEKFLTKREQGLLQRRQQAEELLQWKQRLDQEEAEVHRMEKALSQWDRPKAPSSQANDRSEVNLSSSSLHPVQSAGHQDLPDQASPGSEVMTDSSVHTAPPSNQGSPASYSQDFSSSASSPRSLLPPRASPSPSQPAGGSVTTQLHTTSLTPTAGQDTHTEGMSEPSDIEGRIGALKEELRQRRAVVYQLKKEQKKRHKERLKAQEASLLKQLESYNVFIQKTKGELKKQPDLAPTARPQIKTPSSSSFSSADQSHSKRPPASRADSSRSSVRVEGGTTRRRSPADPDELSHPGHSRSTSLPEEISDEDPPTVTPTPVQGSPEHPIALEALPTPEPPSRTGSKEAPSLSSLAQPRGTESGDRSHASSLKSEVLEELEEEGRSDSERLLRLDREDRPASRQNGFESEPSSGTIKPHGAAGQEGASPRETISMETPRPASEHQEPSLPLGSGRNTPDSSLASTGEGYQEDFDSSMDSSPRGNTQRASPSHPETRTSQGASSRSRSPHSQEEEVEEDLAEESSERSGTPSRHSDSLFDLQRRPKVSPPGHSQEKSLIQSNHSPTLSPSTTTPPPPPPLPDHMPDFTVGDRVLVSNVQPGTLRFKGQTQFANGFWAGVELDESEGSNNGTYDDVVYFQCPERHGIFAPPDKISHLPETLEMEAERTRTEEDEDSLCDDPSLGDRRARDKPPSAQGRHNDHTPQEETTLTGGHRPVPNGRTVVLEIEDAPTSLLISDVEKTGQQRKKETSSPDLPQKVKAPAALREDTTDTAGERDTEKLSAFADKLLDNFVKDAVKHFTRLRRAKEEKVAVDNQRTEDLFRDGQEEEDRENTLAVQQKYGVPFFLDAEQEEASSPELCSQRESPVLGPRGQEELAKRLAKLELSRGLLEQLGDDEEEEEEQEQDWFDEDYGLSSRRQQQKQKEEEEVGKGGVPVTVPGEGLQDKIPPRPELPLPKPPKLPEQPAMVVPHTASQVEKLVHAATQEIWEGCGLGRGNASTGTLAGVPLPRPSQAFLLGGCAADSDPPDLGKETGADEQEAVCNRSYRQAVFDLTWELLQEIYGDDPGSQHPQWVKPRRANSSYSHRVRTPAGADLSMVQAYVTSEVLKLYRLKKDSNQKSDWQKMLKFGRKKRDRVDHILVQELHEEEAQWVDYDEDELFVKQQLADSIFEALLKDTADAFTHIHRARDTARALLS